MIWYGSKHRIKTKNWENFPEKDKKPWRKIKGWNLQALNDYNIIIMRVEDIKNLSILDHWNIFSSTE